jgi:hypothetical protein
MTQPFAPSVFLFRAFARKQPFTLEAQEKEDQRRKGVEWI